MLTLWNSYYLPLNWSCGFSCEQAMMLGLYCVKCSLQKSLPSTPKHYHTQSPCLASTRAGLSSCCFSLLGKTCWNNYLLTDLHIRGLSVLKKKKKKTHCVTSWKELLSLFRRNHAGLSSGLQCCFFDQHSRGNSEYSQKYIQVLVIIKLFINILIFSSVCQSCPTLCSPIDCSTPGFPVHHQLLELAQTHVHWVGDQPSHPLSSPSPPAFSHSQHQGLFKWVSSSHQVAKDWSFSFSISPSNEYSGLISFRMDWLNRMKLPMLSF